jgi:hypothetical protein
MFAREKRASPRKSQGMMFGSLARPVFPDVTRTAVTRYNTGATANMTCHLDVFELAEKTTLTSFFQYNEKQFDCSLPS